MVHLVIDKGRLDPQCCAHPVLLRGWAGCKASAKPPRAPARSVRGETEGRCSLDRSPRFLPLYKFRKFRSVYSKGSTVAMVGTHPEMPIKRASAKVKSEHVFGQARKRSKMFRAALYARVSTNDQQTRDAAAHAAEIRKLHRAGVSKSEIARRIPIGRTWVRRILAARFPSKV